ncbi:hypothetical protein CANARDRAFT_6471 [[Candida] arabinofermentans NRRL YB-2248]|uniref:26S proteasome regulatory subunit RPN1 n=1 Tax=[Candida] arabinofermentans NRRL YB-2248 TaxID=983967 RepID=A0A1E4T5A2_9ASCO|nr:hypothetical protein CANARDRAFT_6471 [[Candida] arabinofermentans NRRL YB-2248]
MAPVEDTSKANKTVDDATAAPIDLKEKEKSKKKDEKNASEEEELSEEDQQLKSELELLVEKLTENNESLYESSLESLKTFIRDSTSSMTAVPKPLKFLRSHYPTLTNLYTKWQDEALKSKLADILSVLGMTYSEDDGAEYKRESLKYRLLSNIDSSIGEWGHEYLRYLSLGIGEEYQDNLDSGLNRDETNSDVLVKLSLEIVPYFLKHNAEAEAVDLLLEVEEIQKLTQFVDKDTFNRVCLYMVSCVPLLAPPDDLAFLHTAFSIYLANDQLPQALALAIRLGDDYLIQSVFDATNDELVQKQLGFVLGRQNSCFKVDNESVQECISNVKLSEYYKYLVGELNLLQPKVPEDIYKSHLENSTFGSSSRLESAKQNLAASFVNAFVNTGYGSEKLIRDEKWIYRTKGEGMLSTTASLGLINLWDINDGLQILDKHLYSEQNDVKAGALLGMGISSTSVHDEVDPALLLLQDHINSDSKVDSKMITAAITGIGIAFAGSENEDVLNLLLPLVSEPSVSLEIQSLSALALGHVYVGTCNGDITSTILQTLLEKEFEDLSSKWIRFMSLGLGLLYMGKYEQVDDVLETIDAIDDPISKTLKVLVTICSYAGTGNVLQLQSLLQMCTIKTKDDDEDEDEDNGDEEESGEAKKEGESATAASTTNTTTEEKEETTKKSDGPKQLEDETYQGYAVLGVGLVSMGEEIGQEMSLRHFDHLMHYGSPLIKRAVPLAMGLVSASNAQMKVFDTLSRYSHDQDLTVAYNAIFGMGLVGAGTNNARLAQLLRQLALYYVNDQNALFLTRISQGLVHLGKGTLTLSPFNTDRQVLSKVSLASLLTVGVALLDPTAFILDQHSSLLYYITPSIKPRMLVTVDEELNPIKVNVRVGQAVDVVGQAGKPKTITGWVTHSTPVLLGYGERAELENDEYLSLASSLEGVVILKKNPDYMDVDA